MRNKYRVLFSLGILAELAAIVYFAAPLFLHTPVAFIQIKSNSMAPTLQKGALVLVDGRDKDPEALVKKVIAFYDPTQGKIIVHRAIALKGQCVVTKGDNANSIDFFSPAQEYILGKVIM